MYTERGEKEMLEKMAAIERKVSELGTQRAVRAGGNVIRRAMVERAPVLTEFDAASDSLNPGDVKTGIRVRVKKSKDGEAYALIGPIGKGGAVPRVAHLVEYGHRMVTGGESRINSFGGLSGPGKHVGYVPPHPFLRPAFESSAEAAMEAVAESLSATLREAAK